MHVGSVTLKRLLLLHDEVVPRALHPPDLVVVARLVELHITGSERVVRPPAVERHEDIVLVIIILDLHHVHARRPSRRHTRHLPHHAHERELRVPIIKSAVAAFRTRVPVRQTTVVPERPVLLVPAFSLFVPASFPLIVARGAVGE